MEERTYRSPVRGDEITGTGGRQWEFAYREALSPYIFWRVLVVVGIYLGAYAAICPLGADHITSTQRFLYLALGAALCAPLCYAEYVVTLYLTRHWAPWQIALAVAAGTLAVTPTAVAIAYGVDTLSGRVLHPDDLPMVYLFMTLSLVLGSAVIHYLVSQRVRNKPSRDPATDTLTKSGTLPAPGTPTATGPSAAEAPSKFLDRLPVEVGQDVVYLKMSDHYVKVVTTLGQCDILMRFADAIAELGDRGLRVHRSYWVAYPHVEGWRRHNQRTLLQLTGGHVVPVSRTYLGDLRAALVRRRPALGTADPIPAEDR